MEPHKLRENLQKRSIVPSENSWEQLSEKLDSQENIQKTKKGIFLKYAAIILVFVSVGAYFFKPVKQITDTPIIAAPTLKNEVEKTLELLEKPEVRVAEIPAKQEKKQVSDPSTNSSIKEYTALANTEKQLLISKIANTETELVEVPAKEILVVEQLSEEQILDAEVDQLLKASKIKLSVNRELSSRRVVSAQALLNEVEDDLNKDFKEKLFETIVTTLKKPRKVVITDRGN